MQEKTINSLNQKIWYRLLKVIYLFLFILALIGYNFTIYYIGDLGLKNVSQKETKITCLQKDKKVFSPKDIGISISRHDLANKSEFKYKEYFESYNEFDIKAILKACYDQNVDDVYAVQRHYELEDKNTPLSTDELIEIAKIYDTFSTSEKTSYLDYSFKLFDINPVLTYEKFLLLFLLGNVVIILIFELFRRISYYILLGKIFPAKN